MAIMISCATDWTLDLFIADMNKAKALPLRKGVHLSSKATSEEHFCTWLKTSAKFFLEDWLAEHDGRIYDRYDGYVGDAWLYQISDCLSDWYKDTYNQRPHFYKEYFAKACNLPTNADILLFGSLGGSTPFENDLRSAKRNRERF